MRKRLKCVEGHSVYSLDGEQMCCWRLQLYRVRGVWKLSWVGITQKGLKKTLMQAMLSQYHQLVQISTWHLLQSYKKNTCRWFYGGNILSLKGCTVSQRESRDSTAHMSPEPMLTRYHLTSLAASFTGSYAIDDPWSNVAVKEVLVSLETVATNEYRDQLPITSWMINEYQW